MNLNEAITTIKELEIERDKHYKARNIFANRMHYDFLAKEDSTGRASPSPTDLNFVFADDEIRAAVESILSARGKAAHDKLTVLTDRLNAALNDVELD